MIESHPSLGHAAMLVAAAVNEDAATGGAGAMPGGVGNVGSTKGAWVMKVGAGTT